MSILEFFANQGSEIKKSNYWWKIILITFFSAIFAILVGVSLGNIFTRNNFLGTSALLMFIVFVVLFAIFFILESLFSQGVRFGSIVIQSILITFGFYIIKYELIFTSFNLLWSGGVCLVLLFFLWFGRLTIRKKKNDLLKLRWNEMIKSGLTLILVGINFFVCLQWMGGIILKPDNLITQESIDIVLKPGTPILKLYFKDFTPNMEINDFIVNLATSQVEKSFEQQKEELKNISKTTIAEQKKKLIEENINSIKDQLNKEANIQLTEKETFSNVFYEFLNNKYQKLDIKIKQYIILLIALLMFIIFRVIAIFVALIIRIIGWFFYEFSIASGYGAIKYESRNKEDLTIY